MINPAVKDVLEEGPIENAGEVEKHQPPRRSMQSPNVPNDKEDRCRRIAYESNPVIRLVRCEPFQLCLLNSSLFRGVGHDSRTLTARILITTAGVDNRIFASPIF
jgi:hypothetical protein